MESRVALADVRTALAVRGTDLKPSPPEAYGAFIRAEIEKWSKVIRAVGLENSASLSHPPFVCAGRA